MLRNLLRQPALALALTLVFAAPASAMAADKAASKKGIVPLDRIIAVVNDDVITQFELNHQIKTVTKQLQKQGAPLPPPEILERQLLERIITDRVQLHYARETGLRVDDAQLDKTLNRIAQENKLTLQQLRDALERDGVNFNKFREEIRAEIIMTRLKEREVDNKIIVTEAELDNELSAQQTQTGKRDEYNLAHILIRVPEQASAEQIQARKERASQALAQLKNGADFAQVSAEFSDAPDALQEGSLGWRPADRLPGIFVEALAGMKVGELTPVLRSPNGFHIIKLLDLRGKDSASLVTQTRAQHILVKTSEVVSERDAKNRLLQLKERIDNGADFAELARRHSDDPSASRGGEIGWISPGDTVSEFERAMDGLKPGQVSEPVPTPFGWHLIKVLERRTEDMSHDRQRMQARLALRARKSEEAYQEWLRQLRDRAYIEYRFEER